MNEQFTFLLEDEWDHIFQNLQPEQQSRLLEKLQPPDQFNLFTVDEAFNHVLRQGNDGFHQFAKALHDEVCFFAI